MKIQIIVSNKPKTLEEAKKLRIIDLKTNELHERLKCLLTEIIYKIVVNYQ